MGNYAYMQMGKVKSFSGSKGLSAMYDHNFRNYDVENADPKLSDHNEELFKLNGLNYIQAFEKNIEEFREKGIETKIRKNAILALDVMLTYSNDANVDFNAWKEANVKWLDETFNKEIILEDGSTYKPNNVISAVLHIDEQTPHIHAVVVPRDEKGKLNGSRYMESPFVLARAQSDYAKAMSVIGLERGVEGRKTDYRHIKHFYNALEKVYDDNLPEPKPMESTLEYRARANKQYIDSNLHNFGVIKELNHQLASATAIIKNKEHELSVYEDVRIEIGHDLDEFEFRHTLKHDVRTMELAKRALEENPNNNDIITTIDKFNDMINVQQRLEAERLRSKDKELRRENEQNNREPIRKYNIRDIDLSERGA